MRNPNIIKSKTNMATAIALSAAAFAGCGKGQESTPNPSQPNGGATTYQEGVADYDDTHTIETPNGSPEGAVEGPSPMEVATAYTRAFAESDPDTICNLLYDKEECVNGSIAATAAQNANNPEMANMLPGGGKEIPGSTPQFKRVELPTAGYSDISYCVSLNSLSGKWLVDGVIIGPPGKCD